MNELEFDKSNHFDQKLQGSFFSSFQNEFMKQGHDGDNEIIKFDKDKTLEREIQDKAINFDSQDFTSMSKSYRIHQNKMDNHDSLFESPQFYKQIESFMHNQENNNELKALKGQKKASETDQITSHRFESQGSNKSLQARKVQKRFSNQNYQFFSKDTIQKTNNNSNDQEFLKITNRHGKNNESFSSFKKCSIMSPVSPSNSTQNNLINKNYASGHFNFTSKKNEKEELTQSNKNMHAQPYSQQQSIKIDKAIKIIQQIKNTRLNQVTRVQSIVQRFVNFLLIYSGKYQINLLQQHQFEQVNDLSSFYQRKAQTGLLNKIKNEIEILFSHLSLNIPVMMPSDIFTIFWDIFLVLYTIPTLMIYSVLTFCAQDQPDQIIYVIIFKIMLFIFLLDIILNFNFAHFSKDAIVIDRKLIAKKYLRQNFITDSITVIILIVKIYFSPLPLFYNPDDDLERYITNSLVFLKLQCIAQKTSRFDEIMQSKESQKHKLRLLKLIIQIILIAHTFAVGWNIIAIIENNYGIQDTWVSKKLIQNQDWITKYIVSFYWCITTMTTVGFGDIVASNQYEYLFMSMAMIFMSCNFAYTISNVGLILSEIEKNKRELNNCISNIQRYLDRKNVNISLKSRVRSYLVFLYQEQKDRNQEAEEKVFQKLSNKLRREITQEINGKIVNACSIFTKNFSSNTLNKLVFAMKECVVSPNELIFNEGEQDDMSIYFIQSGFVDIFQQKDGDKNKQINQKVIKTLGQNQMFGELSFFSGLPRKASAKSVNLTTLYKLSSEDFIKIVKENQEDFERYSMIREQIMVLQDLQQINVECYTCNTPGHISAECPIIHLQFNKQFKSLRNNFSIIQPREQNENRNLKMRFNPRCLVEMNKQLQRKLKDNSIYMDSHIRVLFNNDDKEEQDSESETSSDSVFDKISTKEQNIVLQSQLQILQNTEGRSKTMTLNQKNDRRKSKRFTMLGLKQQVAMQESIDKETLYQIDEMTKQRNSKYQKPSSTSFQSFQDINKINEQIIFHDQLKNEKYMSKLQNTINEVKENISDGSDKNVNKQVNMQQQDQNIQSRRKINSKDSFKVDSEFMLNSNLSQENAIHSPRVLNVSPTNQINQFQDFQDIYNNDVDEVQQNISIRKKKQRFATQPPQSYKPQSNNVIVIDNKNYNILNNLDSQKQIRERTKSNKNFNDRTRQKIMQSNGVILTQIPAEKQEFKRRCSIESSNRKLSKYLFNGQLPSYQYIENKGSSLNALKMEESTVNRYTTVKMEDSQQMLMPYQGNNQIDLKQILLLNQLGKRNNNSQDIFLQLDKQSFSKYFYKFSFENMKIYKIFFPHNNYNKVIHSFKICQINQKKQKKHKSQTVKKQKVNPKDTQKATEFSLHQFEKTSQNEINYKPTFISYGISLSKNFRQYPANNLKIMD